MSGNDGNECDLKNIQFQQRVMYLYIHSDENYENWIKLLY